MLRNREIPTHFRLWHLHDAALEKAIKKWFQNKPEMEIYFKRKAIRFERLTTPRPDWWSLYFVGRQIKWKDDNVQTN
jgi:hypothetical protein